MPLPSPEPASTTQLLARAREGERDATSQLFDLLYGELRARARAILGHAGGATLQPTVLVHEAWLKLVPGKQTSIQDRNHFLSLAATAMRSVLVDHARARNTDKRGGDRKRGASVDLCAIYAERAVDILGLDDALRRLGELDAQLPRVVELRFFAGLEVDAVAAVLQVSSSTVERAWRTARTWLRAELGER